jgi:hypothetical protein
MWLVWLLHDSRNPKLPPRAWPEKQHQYQRVQGNPMQNTEADSRAETEGQRLFGTPAICGESIPPSP